MNQQKDSTEQDWLDNVEKVFQYAKKQNPPNITRSEVDSLIIGLRSLAKSPKALKVLQMLQSYSDFMKMKHRPSMRVVENTIV